MGINNLASLSNGEHQQLFTSFRKLPVVAPAGGVWIDLSMSPGFPVPNYYASNPLESKYMSYSRQKGIPHGQAYSSKYLYESTLMGTNTQWANTTFIMCDYLLYYPFVDEGITDEQVMNNLESLTRYTDGKGVMMVAVSLGGRIGGKTFQVTYTNQDGVSGRVTPLIMGNNASTVNGSLMNTSGTLSVQGALPYLPLMDGDSGVRSIQSVKMISGTDTGIFALVLVKPIATMVFGEGGTLSYRNHISESGLFPPKINDDAYLNIVASSNGAFSGQTIMGLFNFLVR